MGDKVIEEDVKRDLKGVSVAVATILKEYDGCMIVKEGNTVVGFADKDGKRFYFNVNGKEFRTF